MTESQVGAHVVCCPRSSERQRSLCGSNLRIRGRGVGRGLNRKDPLSGPNPAYIPFSRAIGFLTLPTERTFRTGSLNTSIVVGSL